MTTAKECVKANANNSPVHRYVADHGQTMAASTECLSLAGQQVRVAEDTTQSERSLIRDALEAVPPTDSKCYRNALLTWQYDDRFKYAEGFAIPSHISDRAFEHAWSMLDGEKLVDFTPEFDDHYGVLITSDQIIEQYIGSNLTSSGIINNYDDQFKFLRERGYYDAYSDG